MEFKKEDLIKSPLNYTGGKFKLLPQLLPLFPNNINTFVDLFAGGCNVGINVSSHKVICNDIEDHVVELMEYLYRTDINEILTNVQDVIKEYNLSETSKNGFEYYGCSSKTGRRIGIYNDDKYIKLRDFYNTNKNPLLLYVLSSYSFNNQIRFNKKLDFNMPCGKQDFNNAVKGKLIKFKHSLNNKIITFTNKDFFELNLEKLNNDDLVYCDPPYLVACASYNEQDGWNNQKEMKLLDLLDKINENGVKFALSNVFKNKGKTNDILIEWSKKYNINYLNHTYGNCSYHAKDKSSNSTVEVLITNY